MDMMKKDAAAAASPDEEKRTGEDRLEELVEELLRAGASAGPVTSPDEDRVRGMAFLLRDLKAEDLERLADRLDLILPMSPGGLETLTYLKQVVAENRSLKELAVTDTLTGLYNVRHFNERLMIELHRVRRTEKSCSLLMIDLDKFKPVNDQFGHQTGDELLKVVAEIIRTGIRAMDVPCRYGGDEFAVILPDTGLKAAIRTAERIRQSLEADERTAGHGVTGSFGLATCHHFSPDDPASLVERADRALYLAKKQGGNLVKYFEADGKPEEPTEVTVSEREDLYFHFEDE